MGQTKEERSYAYRQYVKLKEEKGLTDYAVWQKSNNQISRAALGDWKKGKYELKLDKLEVIAQVMHVPVSYFIDGDSETKV